MLADTPAIAPRSAILVELGALIRLAVPLATAQLAQIAINTTDVLLLGRLGARPLASASLGMTVFFPLLVFGMGVVMATSTLLAQARGAGRPLQLRRILQQGWLVTAAIALPLMLLLSQVTSLLALIGEDPSLLAGTDTFLDVLLWGLPGALVAVLLRGFVTAFGISRPVLVVTLAAVALNALLAYGLIFGRLGLPALGLVGAGLASALTNTAMALAAMAWCLVDRRFRRFVVAPRLRIDPQLIGAILRLGLPIGGALIMEAGLFASAGLLMGLLGTTALAAHQVTIQICSTLFMIPLGVGLAATVRTALFVGAGDAIGARRAGLVAFILGAAIMLGVAVLFVTSAPALVGIFLTGDDAMSRNAADLAARLLRIAAIFQLVDGLQVIANSSLRGLGDTRVPMGLAAAGYWVVGFPACALLGLATPLGGQGVWLGLACALATVAILLLRRFDRLTRAGRPA